MPIPRGPLRYGGGGQIGVVLAAALTVALVTGAIVAGRSRQSAERARVLGPIGATDVALTTDGSFSARLPAGMVVAARGGIRAAIGVVQLEGALVHRRSRAPARPVRVLGVDEAFWTFHGAAPVPLGERDVALSAALAGELGAREGDGIRLIVGRPGEVPATLVPGRRHLPDQAIEVVAARILDEGPGPNAAFLDEDVPVVVAPLALVQRELSMAGRINAVLVQLSARSEDRTAGPAERELVQRAWLDAATLPDHGLRIRRVPGDGVMALEGLGGVIAPDVAARVMAALARLQRPGIPALTTVATTIRHGDRAIPASFVTAIDLDGYLRLSVPAGPPAPGVSLSGGADPLVRGAFEIRVGRGGARAGRMQVVELPAPPPGAAAARARTQAAASEALPTDGPLWLNEWAASDLDVVAGDTVHLEWLSWEDAQGLVPRHASFVLSGVVPMMRAGGDRTLSPEFPGLAGAPSLMSWQPSFPFDPATIRPEDEAYWAQWRSAPKAFVPLETGQRLWGTRRGPVSSIRFAVRDADTVAAAVRAEPGTRIAVGRVRAEAIAAIATPLRAGMQMLALHVVPIAAALLLVWLTVTRSLDARARDAAVLSALGYTAREVRATYLREGSVLLGAGTVLGIGGAVMYATALLTALAAWWPESMGRGLVALRLDLVGLGGGALAGAALVLVAGWLGLGATPPRHPQAVLMGPTGGLPRRRLGSRPLVALAAMAGVVIGATLGPSSAAPADDSDRAGGFDLQVDARVPLLHHPLTAEGRAALGQPNDEALWQDVRLARLRIRDGSPQVIGVPVSALTGRFRFVDAGAAPPGTSPWSLLDAPVADERVPVVVDRAFARARGVGVGDELPLDDDDAAAPPGVVVALLEPGLLPRGVLVSEERFVEMYPHVEGARVWLVDVPDADKARVTRALAEALTSAGVRVSAAGEILAAGRARGDAARAVWRALTIGGLALGVIGAISPAPRRRSDRPRRQTAR